MPFWGRGNASEVQPEWNGQSWVIPTSLGEYYNQAQIRHNLPLGQSLAQYFETPAASINQTWPRLREEYGHQINVGDFTPRATPERQFPEIPPGIMPLEEYKGYLQLRPSQRNAASRNYWEEQAAAQRAREEQAIAQQREQERGQQREIEQEQNKFLHPIRQEQQHVQNFLQQQINQQMGMLKPHFNPAILNEIKNQMEQQNTKFVHVKPKESLYDKIAKSFDPRFLSPEFMPEEE